MMPSAFERPNSSTKKGAKEHDIPPPLDSETEDEEVRMNCIAGLRGGLDESDVDTMNQSCNEDVEDNEEEDLENDSSRLGVVTFVTFPSRNKQELIRPIASPPIAPRLSPIIENVSGSLASSQPSKTESDVVKSEVSLDERVNDYNADKSDSETEEQYDDDEIDERKTELEVPTMLHSFDSNQDSVDAACCHNLRFIGVMEDLGDSISIPNVKRVLSFNTLAALNADIDRQSSFLLKRPRLDSALESLFRPLTLSDLIIRNAHERPYSTISSSDDEDLDRQLEEELDGYSNTSVPQAEDDREKTPVPLLTPPGSPLTVVLESGVTTICEWPSNLTVDSAMQAVHELRPLSPASLELLEIDEQDRLDSAFRNDILSVSVRATVEQEVSV